MFVPLKRSNEFTKKKVDILFNTLFPRGGIPASKNTNVYQMEAFVSIDFDLSYCYRIGTQKHWIKVRNPTQPMIRYIVVLKHNIKQPQRQQLLPLTCL